MRTTKLFFLFTVLLLGIFACDNEEETPTDEDGIVGSWEVIGYDYAGVSTSFFNGTSISSNFMGTARDITATVEFRADGTYASQGDYTIDLKYDAGGQIVTQPYVFSNFLGAGTYVVVGNTMTVTDGPTNETNEVEITKLEGDDLEMDYVLSRTISQQGVTNTAVFDGQATFKRK